MEDGKRGKGFNWVVGLFLVSAVVGIATAMLPFQTHKQTTDTSGGGQIAIAPGGKALAYQDSSTSAGSGGVPAIWVRDLTLSESRMLPGTEGGSNPFWSPNGRYIGFFADNKLKKIEVAGGSPQTLCDLGGIGVATGGTWGPNGTILFGLASGGVQQVSENGGTPTQVTTLTNPK